MYYFLMNLGKRLPNRWRHWIFYYAKFATLTLEWMDTISLQGKTDFFQKSVGEYSKSGVGVDRTDQSFAFALDASFWWGRSHTHIYAQCTDQNICLKHYPPLSHVFASQALRKQTPKQHVNRGYNKVQWFFGGGDPVSLTRTHQALSGSVMIN